jgi:hypothetical protein
MITLVRPSEGPISQLFGNIQPDGNPHAGSDFAYTRGGVVYDKVLAAADGVVLFAGDARGLTWPNIMYANPDFDRTDTVDSSAGNYTILAHYVGGERVALTGYAHQQEIWVRAGDQVRAGKQIGVVGTTGFSSGKHLHFDFVPAPFVVSRAPYYGRIDPEPFFNGLGLQAQGTTTSNIDSEENFMAGTIDPQQAEDIVQSTVARVVEELAPLLANRNIDPQQAEDIVQATTERVVAQLKDGEIDRQQADDIARAAAAYAAAKAK